MTERMTVAAAMVKCLEMEKIRHVFGYPGAAICPFYDALLESDIEHILVRHEANGGHSASGYARMTGKPAVCIATSGPGATNLITAIATAYMDSIPLIAITGQVNSDQIGRDVFQEADITGSAEPFVKHSFLVKNPEEICKVFKQAFFIAGTGRPGPVLIDIPMDVQKQECDFSYPESIEIRSYKPRSEGNKLQIKRVCEAIAKAKKPLICAGGGIFTANAKDELRRVAELCNIPVINTMMGLSSMDMSHRLYFGMLGMHGVKSANYAVANCDLFILLGARVGDRAVTAIQQLSGIEIIHIDIDPAEIGKNLSATTPLVGDLKIILNQIIETASELKHTAWVDELTEVKNAAGTLISEEKPGTVNPKFFIHRLNEHLPDSSVVVADVGQNQIWTANNIFLRGGRFMTAGGMGTMGYSIPAAIGAKKASPESQVIAICGDGSFQMQMMELATAVQHKIAVKIIVMVNHYLGMVREVQENAYHNRLIGVSLDGSPQFDMIARAYGIKAETVDSLAYADEAIKRLIESDEPYLLQVIVGEKEKTIL